jgi:hypothetical protein
MISFASPLRVTILLSATVWKTGHDLGKRSDLVLDGVSDTFSNCVFLTLHLSCLLFVSKDVVSGYDLGLGKCLL